MIYFTSDLHFGHNKDFIYAARGFASFQEHDAAIIGNINEVVQENDTLYILGDIFLGKDYYYGIGCLEKINCKNIHIICGNHDTDNKIELYRECENVVEVAFAARLKYRKVSFFLSHYPTITDNYDDNDDEKFIQHTVNLFGHTHQSERFYTFGNQMNPYMYNVSLDAHSNYPVSIDAIVDQIKVVRRILREEV